MPFSLKNLLETDKEQELLRSFVRVEIGSEPPEVEHAQRTKQNDVDTSSKGRKKSVAFMDGHKNEKTEQRKKSEAEIQPIRKRKPREVFNDYYTDKDRAAAVSAGSYDIKQSLQLKKQQDRNEVLLVVEEDISSLISLGLKEMKNSNTENAITCFTKALELNKADVNALVARSKCYLLLGEASKALQDAEMALNEDPNNMRAIYQKAESLYYLGQFEQSLMFFHRGLRARPELASIRLGVQKNQEAIENTIGSSKQTKILKKSVDNTPRTKSKSQRNKTSAADMEKRIGRKLLGELRIDKEYLENLLKHPDLSKGNKLSENVCNFATDAVDFLNKREEFWRQQRPCSVLLSQKNMPQDALPHWF